MTFRYNISDEDFIQYSLFISSRTKMVKRAKLLFTVLSAIPMTIAIIWILVLGIPDYEIILKAAVISVPFVFARLCISTGTRVKSMKILLKEPTAKEYTGIRDMSLLDGKLREESSTTIKETDYEGIVKVAADKERFFIFSGVSFDYIVPFSAFENGAAKGEFLAVLKERCKECEFV